MRRDNWLALGLVLLLVGVVAAATLGGAGDQELPPLTVDSTGPEGARALWLWLEGSGYDVDRSTGAVFSIPAGTSIIFMLEPLMVVNPLEWQILDEWVQAGGTLVIAGDGLPAALAMDHYEVELRLAVIGMGDLRWETPLMVQPVVTTTAGIETEAALSTDREDVISHLAGERGAAIVSIREGEGIVILSATAQPFTNAGLKAAGNGELVLNMAHAGGVGRIWFDEWHHGLRGGSEMVEGPGEWLRRTPAGRAVMYSAGVVFVALALAGRRFGRAVIPARDRARRGPIEYLTAIANLSWRAGHRRHVLERYHHQLKATLGARYRLSPTLEDEAFVAQLKGYNPQLDEGALLDVLRRLRAEGVTEAEMVRLAAEVARLTPPS